MNAKNKFELLHFLCILLICIMSFVVLIPNVEIWNMAHLGYTDTFHVIASIINLIFGGLSVYVFGKALLSKVNEKYKR